MNNKLTGKIDIPEPRIKKHDLKMPSPNIPLESDDPPMPGDYKLPWYEFYRRNGFKRILGGVTLITGGILSLIPVTSAIGQGILILGGVIEGVGLGHGAVKNRQKKETTMIDSIPILKWIADLLIKLFIKNKEK